MAELVRERLDTWVSKKGIKFYPVLQKGQEGVIYLYDGPYYWTHLRKVSLSVPDLAGCIVWDLETEMIETINTTERWRRQGIATYLYEQARLACPELKHSDALSADAESWIESLGKKVPE